jgi:hypothetical protein
MISVAVYGRNDNHGYNLHRRVALSLNCLAEVLTDPDDEIIFVDWNTPKRLPPFPVAVADTLTSKARSLIKTVRVSEALHAERFGNKTHLPTVEPVARNAALVRANPRNRWFLSTNTDMCLLPKGGSLSDLVADLDDGYYALPRFELPEVFWESLPRTDPKKSLLAIQRWSERFALKSIVESHEFNRFDAPGDFQLAPREAFLEIGGFDEQMILGWHVDSNMAKRLWLYFGETRSLEHCLSGFHCNHTRALTVHHGVARRTNDLARFVSNIDNSLPTSAQKPDMGLRTVDLPMLRVEQDPLDLIPPNVGFEAPIQFASWLDPASMSECSSRHAVSVLLDPILNLQPTPRVAYVGKSDLCIELTRMESAGILRLTTIDVDLRFDTSSFDLEDQDLLVFDFSFGGGKKTGRIMAEIALRSAGSRPERQPLVATVGAEGNQFDTLIALVVSAPGSQSAFRTRVGVFSPQLRNSLTAFNRIRVRFYNIVRKRTLPRDNERRQHKPILGLAKRFIVGSATLSGRALVLPVRLLLNLLRLLARILLPRRANMWLAEFGRSRLIVARSEGARMAVRLKHRVKQTLAQLLRRRYEKLEARLKSNGAGAVILRTWCET